jgi:transcriptional regulator, GntR family
MKATVQPLAAEVPQDRKAVLAEALRRRILSMELAPGAVVDELALCDEFGLSRPPVVSCCARSPPKATSSWKPTARHASPP